MRKETPAVRNLFLLDLLAAVVLAGLWYFLFARYNRRKGIRALRWVEAACSNRARIVEARWLGASRLQAQLRFAAHWFENARVTIRLIPRPLPIQWALSHWHKQRETLTFEADLDYVPAIQLEIRRHRWLTDSNRSLTQSSRNWTITRPGPVILTTSTEWRRELPPIVNALMTTRGHNLLSVRLDPDSPNLAATIDLNALSDEEAAAGFLGVVRDLAAGASASRP
jgi:hypothetical protein